MDFSKLPKLGRTTGSTPTAEPGPPNAPHSGVPPTHAAPSPGFIPGGWADAGLGLAIGAILLVMSPRLIQYLVSPDRVAREWQFTAPDGGPLPYPKTVFFWGDLAITAFALAVMVEAVAMGFARRPITVLLALLLASLVVAGNLAYAVAMMVAGYPTPLLSVVAVALGAYGCGLLYQRYRAMGAFRPTADAV